MLTWVLVSVAVKVCSSVLVWSMISVDTQTRVVGTSEVEVTISVEVKDSMSVIVCVTVSNMVTVVGTVEVYGRD